MKAVELRDMDVESLRARTQEIDDQLFRMRIRKSMGQLEAPGKMRDIKRDRARILTILKEKAK
jgi:large subunit ribosomal protein L29